MADPQESAATLMSQDTIIFAYATAPDQKTAEEISHQLLQERIIACVNILPQMKSLYWWKGQIESSDEVVMILKTRRSLWESLAAKFTELHPYETPCLIEIPLGKGLPDYLQWLMQETSS